MKHSIIDTLHVLLKLREILQQILRTSLENRFIASERLGLFCVFESLSYYSITSWYLSMFSTSHVIKFKYFTMLSGITSDFSSIWLSLQFRLIQGSIWGSNNPKNILYLYWLCSFMIFALSSTHISRAGLPLYSMLNYLTALLVLFPKKTDSWRQYFELQKSQIKELFSPICMDQFSKRMDFGLSTLSLYLVLFYQVSNVFLILQLTMFICLIYYYYFLVIQIFAKVMQQDKSTESTDQPVYRFSLNAQIQLTKNSMPLILQARNNTRVFTLSIQDPKFLVVHCIPTSQVFYKFNILNLKTFHNKFVPQGKLTIIIKDGVAKKKFNSLAMSLDGLHNQDLLVQINISKAVPGSLDLLIRKMKEIIEKARENFSAQNNSQSKEVPQPKNERMKKTQPLPSLERQQMHQKFSRKSIMKQAADEERMAPKLVNKKQYVPPQPPKPKPNMFNSIPLDVLLTIFSYSRVSLEYRLLSKDCSNLVLSGLTQLHLKPDIPQQTFQKLTKYALKITCRMKNIKSLSHLVNNSIEGPLLPNNCKWLDFSQWREMKIKHLNELVGVRLYYLSLCYHSSINSLQLQNLKMTWLCLSSRNNTRNLEIKDEHIVNMINKIEQLTRLEIVCFYGDLLDKIGNKTKIKLLKIDQLDISTTFSWEVLKKFQQLEVLQITSVVSRATGNQLKCTQFIFFPDKIKTLKIGQYFNATRLCTLPTSVEDLYIINQHVRNTHLIQMVLPALRKLNVSKCPLLCPEGFMMYSNLELTVQWDKFVVSEVESEFKLRNIKIYNIAK